MRDRLLQFRRGARLLWFGIRCAVELLPHGRNGSRAAPSYRRLRALIEREGVTYVKIGQFLAMRFDILPASLCHELANLFEGVPPVPFDVARSVIESEFGRPLEQVFAEFRREPVAAASISQVHEGRNGEGKHVAIKILRPGIERIFAADMRVFRRIARLADWLGAAGSISLTMLVDEFARWTTRELDFTLEGRTADTLRRNAAPGVQIPAIDWTRTTRRVLTMEFLDGVSLGRVAELHRSGGDAAVSTVLPGFTAERALHNLASATLHGLFDQGFFHGDLHPGNVLLRSDSTIGLVDFGIAGALPEQRREVLVGYYGHLLAGDIDRSFRFLAQMWTPTDDADPDVFSREVKEALRKWHRSISDPHAALVDTYWGASSDEVFLAARRAHYTMQMDMLLFFRAMAQLHACFLMLSVNFIGELREFLADHRRERLARGLAPDTGVEQLVRVSENSEALPRLAEIAHAAVLQSLSQLIRRTDRRRSFATQSSRAVTLVFVVVSGSIAAGAAALDPVLQRVVVGASLATAVMLAAHLALNYTRRRA